MLPSLIEHGVTVLLMTKHCDTPGIDSFSDKVEEAPDTPLPRSLRSHLTFKSPAVYIYTSGTTGIGVVEFSFLSVVVGVGVCGGSYQLFCMSSFTFTTYCWGSLSFRSSQGCCGQSKPPLNSPGCFSIKWRFGK